VGLRRLTPFLVVEVSTCLSGTANAITEVALPWLVLERTGNAAAAGLVAGLTALPLLISSFLAGTVVDRFGRRRCSIVSDVLSAGSVAAIPLLAAADSLTFVLICIFAVSGAFFDPAGSTAREAMLPEAADAGGLRRERANGIHEAIWGLAFTIGPGVAGLLIATVGAVETLWATAAAFLLSVLIMAVTPIPGGGRPDPDDADDAPTGFWAQTREGVSFVRHDRVLLSMALFAVLLVGTYLPIEGVLLPVHFQRIDEPMKLGLLLTVMSLGWLLGALAYGAVGHRFPRRTTFVASAISCTLALVPLAFFPAYPVMLVCCFFSGFLYGPVGPLLSLAIQRRTPGRMRGRVIGVLGAADYVAGPVGLFLAGPLIEAIGLQPAFMAIVVAVALAGLSTLLMSPLRELDTLPEDPEDPEASEGPPEPEPESEPGLSRR
jgi:MFS family permease